MKSSSTLWGLLLSFKITRESSLKDSVILLVLCSLVGWYLQMQIALLSYSALCLGVILKIEILHLILICCHHLQFLRCLAINLVFLLNLPRHSICNHWLSQVAILFLVILLLHVISPWLSLTWQVRCVLTFQISILAWLGRRWDYLDNLAKVNFI